MVWPFCQCQGICTAAIKTYSTGLAKHWGIFYLLEPKHECCLLQGPTLPTNLKYRTRRCLPCGEQFVTQTSWFSPCRTKKTSKGNSALTHSIFRDRKDSCCECCWRLSIIKNDQGRCYDLRVPHPANPSSPSCTGWRQRLREEGSLIFHPHALGNIRSLKYTTTSED